MKITINITKEEMSHLMSPHVFNDGCIYEAAVMIKIQEQIEKKMGVEK